MGVAGELDEALGLLASGDLPGLLRYLRVSGGALPLGEVARLVAGAGRLAGFDDLAQAAAAAADGEDGSGPLDARVLYDFGYACLGRGACYLAVRPLARALELAPDAAPVESVRNFVRGVVDRSVSAGHRGWPRPWGGQDDYCRDSGGRSRGPGGGIFAGGPGRG